MWAQVDSDHAPDSYMYHAYQFGKHHSSGMKQNVEDFWNRSGRPQKFDPLQAHDFFSQLMREGRADEVNAVHQRAGEKWEAVGDRRAHLLQAAHATPILQILVCDTGTT